VADLNAVEWRDLRRKGKNIHRAGVRKEDGEGRGSNLPKPETRWRPRKKEKAHDEENKK